MTSPAIDIVVPVYNAPDDLRACIASVLACTHGDYRLVVIDDASPDPAVAGMLAELDAKALPHVTVLRNPSNLGFTGTANRGLSLSRADVVLLNSDTIVTSGWLDALLRCAASDERIGTITPFSNNAEICSFPRFCENNAWPAGADPERVREAIAEAAVPCYPDIPTGVGFCMFVRRALIDAVGTFDPAFGAGYGEENDLCLRAHAAGFRNVLCDDAFVVHTGGRSFQGAKEALGVRNTSILLERHPHYLAMVRDYIGRDPLGALRESARTAYDRLYATTPGVLHVLHGGGGTEAYVRALIEATRGRARHALATVRGDTWRIESHRGDGSKMLCEFARRPGEPAEEFVRMLCATFGLGLVHVHNISTDRDPLLAALPRLQVPFGLTVHDLNFACPTITLQRGDGFYCGAVTDNAACSRCLASHDDARLASIDIVRWRERHAAVARAASFIAAPSRFAADAFRRYFPDVDVQVIPHGLPPRESRNGAIQVVLMPDDDVPTVAILGAIGPDKGARRVETLARLAAERDARLRFVVVGYLDRQSDAWRSDDLRLVVHGRYDPVDLPQLLDYYHASLVLFPSIGPETFSFTLSEAWSAGRAVLVPPIGALAERVDHHGAGWILSDAEWRDESLLLDRIEDLMSPYNAVALETAGERAARMPIPSLEQMVDATLANYERFHARTVAGSIEPRRVAEAFGYRPWTPPAVEVRNAGASAEAAAPPASGLVRTAQRLRRTPMGRLLYRLVPPRAVTALKSRLR
jgi:GT2 family glycosyltransferase